MQNSAILFLAFGLEGQTGSNGVQGKGAGDSSDASTRTRQEFQRMGLETDFQEGNKQCFWFMQEEANFKFDSLLCETIRLKTARSLRALAWIAYFNFLEIDRKNMIIFKLLKWRTFLFLFCLCLNMPTSYE